MVLYPASISKVLRKSTAGIWTPSQTNSDVSYPDDHHEQLQQQHQTSFWYRHRERILLNVVKQIGITDLLDVGGSNGVLSRSLSEVLNVTLIEPSMRASLYAKKLGLDHVICSSLEDASLESNTCPAVGLFDVLEHIPDDTEFLKEVKRLLEPSGYLILTVPAYESLWSDFDVRVGHHRRYTVRQLADLLEGLGFRIYFKTYFFSILPLPIYLRRKIGAPSESPTANHFDTDTLVGRIMNTLLKLESIVIARKLRVPFGSSCLVIAQKVG